METIKPWKIKQKRFVAFFDILGFKDLVQRKAHDEIIKKLKDLKKTIKHVEDIQNTKYSLKPPYIKKMSSSSIWSKAISFSDSIVIFSKSDTAEDCRSFLFHTNVVLSQAYKLGIPIKGAISYGEISVDFNDSLFFGIPIIDSSELHNQLHMICVILDHLSINRFTEILKKDELEGFVDYKVFLKSGRVQHFLLKPIYSVQECEVFISKMYREVSGSPRQYLDNTMQFLNFLKEKENNHFVEDLLL